MKTVTSITITKTVTSITREDLETIISHLPPRGKLKRKLVSALGEVPDGNIIELITSDEEEEEE